MSLEDQLRIELARSKELAVEGTYISDFLAGDTIETDRMSLIPYMYNCTGKARPGGTINNYIPYRYARYITQLMLIVVTSSESNPVEYISLYLGHERDDTVKQEHHASHFAASSSTSHYIILHLDTYIDLYSDAAAAATISYEARFADIHVETCNLVVWYMSDELYRISEWISSHVSVRSQTDIVDTGTYYLIRLEDLASAVCVMTGGMVLFNSDTVKIYIHMADYFWDIYMDGIRPPNTFIIPFQTPEGYGSTPPLKSLYIQ